MGSIGLTIMSNTFYNIYVRNEDITNYRNILNPIF